MKGFWRGCARDLSLFILDEMYDSTGEGSFQFLSSLFGSTSYYILEKASWVMPGTIIVGGVQSLVGKNRILKLLCPRWYNNILPEFKVLSYSYFKGPSAPSIALCLKTVLKHNSYTTPTEPFFHLVWLLSEAGAKRLEKNLPKLWRRVGDLMATKPL